MISAPARPRAPAASLALRAPLACFAALSLLVLLAPACGDDSGDAASEGGAGSAGGGSGVGGSTAGASGSKAGAGGSKAGAGGNTPGAGGNTAGAAGSLPGTGGSMPGAGGSAPGAGGNTAGAGGSTAGAGGSTAGAGGSTAGAGGDAPGTGGTSAAGGQGGGGSAGTDGQGAGGGGGQAPGVGGSAGQDAGGNGQGGGGSGQGGGASCVVDGQTHQGDGTFYDATGEGNCSFPASPDNLMVAAMNDADYLGSAVCGACAHIKGPDGEVTVRIVDRCPECKPGDIDLSPQAFVKFAALEKGRVDITWSYVACDVAGPVTYHFKDGSNQWWTAVQVRNHRFPVATFEYKLPDGSYKAVERLDYNFFVEPSGMGPGPFTFRVTDTLGHVIEDTNVPLLDNNDAPGTGQFPACMP